MKQSIEQRILELEKLMYKHGLVRSTVQGSMLVKCLVDVSILEKEGIHVSTDRQSCIVWAAAIGAMNDQKVTAYGLTIESAIRAVENKVRKHIKEMTNG